MNAPPLPARSGAAFTVVAGMLLGLITNQIIGMGGVFGIALALVVLGIWTAQGKDSAGYDAHDEGGRD